MIKVEGISKQFPSTRALDDVSFEINRGEIYALLGPNGAGKSTAINCICGLLTADAGDVFIDGHSMLASSLKAKSSLGLVPQDLALYEDISARENLIFWGSAYGLRGAALAARIDRVLDQVGLSSRQKSPVNQFSGGMKRRLNFACAILHEPKALLLDEPTVGVDPQSREHLLSAVEGLRDAGTAVLYTTHYMEEAERLCDRLGIIDHGKIIAEGSVAELREQMGERDLITLRGDFHGTDAESLKSAGFDFEVLEWQDDNVRLLVADAPARLSQLLNLFSAHRIKQTAVQQANLESLFIKLTGRELRE